MYCKNCGNEINSSEKFCSKCGEVNNYNVPADNSISDLTKHSNFIEKIKKYKWVMFGIIALIMIVIIITSVATSNKPEKKILGQWQVSEISQDENLNDYPEGYFCFFEDGRMTSDDISGTYYFQDDTLTLQYNSMWVGSVTYKYSIHGNTLELKNIEKDESKPSICYEKVE